MKPFKISTKKSMFKSAQKVGVSSNAAGASSSHSSTEPEIKISPELEENFNFIKKTISVDSGLSISKFTILDGEVTVGIVFIDSMTDRVLINRQVIAPMLQGVRPKAECDDLLLILQNRVLPTAGTQRTDCLQQVIGSLLVGNTVLFINGVGSALIVESRKLELRPVESPENEVTILSSRESFTEDLETNTSMLIKRLPIPMSSGYRGIKRKNVILVKKC